MIHNCLARRHLRKIRSDELSLGSKHSAAARGLDPAPAGTGARKAEQLGSEESDRENDGSASDPGGTDSSLCAR